MIRTFSILGAVIFGLVPHITRAEGAQPPDLMSFASGTLPVSATSDSGTLKVGTEHAVLSIDGNPSGYVAHRKPAEQGDAIEFLFALPAPTRFEGFAVPNIQETPSPSQTFFRTVEIYGTTGGADGTFSLLAEAQLETHSEDGQLTLLNMAPDQPEVTQVKVRLTGGIDLQTEKSFLEFSELIGTGQQQQVPLSEGFNGVWAGRGVKIELEQSGATVTGCYDGKSKLTGTVDGNVLRAIGYDDAGVSSQFILIADADGNLRGLRSSNGAPFRTYDGDISSKTPVCLAPEPPKLGCGSIVHGIGFDFDSDVIRPSSEVVIAALHNGLIKTDATIQIVGHSSSEGAADYNRDLSQRRAQSVVAALVALGIDAGKISALGKGEDEPIASNDDEAGRSLNRRVEVVCAG